jgi:myo-inositol-1-phosphate synthase
LKVESPNTKIVDDAIISDYRYISTSVEESAGSLIAKTTTKTYTFKTGTKVPKTGIMLVGLGGNNGTTFVGGLLANKMNMTWHTKKGIQHPTFFGSITQATTTKIGIHGPKEIFAPLKSLLPLVDPNDLLVTGWDISGMDMGEALRRAAVFDYDLQEKLYPLMKDMKPLPGIYYEDFIALNQKERASNVLKGTKQENLEAIRQHIRDFKTQNSLEKVLILWTANTERWTNDVIGVNDTGDNLLKGIKNNHSEISPSTIYAVASILEGCSFINGSPQNTFVPGVIELADKHKVFLVGNDFKTGQTKMKTMLVDFLVSAGIKPRSIVSYNHLGNNDGMNLSQDSQFKSKEKSKKSCVDDIIDSNALLHKRGESIDSSIDHAIVIKYIPSAGDSKKALDEYVSEIFMGGQHTLSIYNVCEDSLLATPIILDLLLLTELFERIEYKNEANPTFRRFDTILSTLGYLMKAPETRDQCPLVNSLIRQKNGIENLFKICRGLPVEDNLLLDYRAK